MAIFFDLDGTLVDTCGDIIAAMNNLCKELGKPLKNFQLLKDNTSYGLETLLSVALDINTKELTKKELTTLKNRFREFYRQSKFKLSTLFPGLELLINKLKNNNIKIAVVTNKMEEFARPILERVNILDKIDCLITSDMVLKPKPEPDMVFLAIEKLKVKPLECTFIGDALQDIVAGNAAGIKTIAALFGYVGDEKKALSWPANYFVKQSTDLLPLLDGLYTLK